MVAAAVPVNATAAALLGLLQHGPATGGELVALAAQHYGGVFGVTRSQVYRELAALAEAGLLRLGKQGPRSSQAYLITAAGRRSFLRWLVADPGGADGVRSPLLLRLMHAGELTPAQRAQLVEQSGAELAQQLQAARAVLRAAQDPYAAAAAEFAVAHIKAVARVVERVAQM